MDAHLRAWATLAVILALMAGMLFAESSAVTASVHASASDGSTQTSSSVITQGSGASGSAAASAIVSDGTSTRASSGQSFSIGTGSDAADGMMQEHLDRVSAVLDDLGAFNFDAALVADARIELAEERQAWADADGEAERRALIERMNAYWANLRDQVRASDVSYDFDVAFGVGNSVGITVVSSSSVSGGVRSSGEASATLNPVFNVADDAGHDVRAERQNTRAGLADDVVNGFAGLVASIGALFGAWVDAAVRLF